MENKQECGCSDNCCNHKGSFMGMLILVLGVIFLLENFGAIAWGISKLWPIILILWGISMLKK